MKVLGTMGIPTLELDNYEADDIIGTFAVHAPEDVEVIIVTGDRDELQLVDTRTKVYYTKRGISDIQIFDEAEFAANYEGLVPKQLIELKGLMGDASDNIPGVPGVGPKTALKLIKEYGDVETVLENIDKVSGKALKAKLADNKESALLSKKLATICTEAPVDTDIAKYALAPLREEARTLMQDLEFRNMYDRFASVLGGAQHSFDLFGETVEQESAPTEHVTLPAQAAQLFAAGRQVCAALCRAVAVGFARSFVPRHGPRNAAIFTQGHSALSGLYIQRIEIVVDGAHISAALIIPAAGLVHKAGVVPCADGLHCPGRIELAPAFVEGHPAADTWMAGKRLYRSFQLPAVFFPAAFLSTMRGACCASA